MHGDVAMDKKTRKIIHKKIDKELSKTETRIFRKKVLSKESSREEYEKIKYVTDGTKRIKQVDTPTNFSRKVVRKIRKKK